MNIVRLLSISALLLSGMYCVLPARADDSGRPVSIGPAVVQLYKGELQVSVPAQQRDSLLFRYRAKNREAVRVGITGLMLTNTRTQEVTRPGDRTASTNNRVDQDGYWIVDIRYSGLKLGSDNYRVEGMYTQYLVGSQRSTGFSVYLQPETASRPADSSIDWGVDNQAR